jgi:hypothetical protein
MVRVLWCVTLSLAACVGDWDLGDDGEDWDDDEDWDSDDDWGDDDVDYGGGGSGGEEDRPASGVPASLSACASDGAAFREALDLYEATDRSVHELVTCGQLQLALVRGFVVSLVVSNSDLLTPEARVGLGGASFTRAADGSYEMFVGGDPRSRFALRFFEAGRDETIAGDVFRLDSYLAGVRVDASMTFDEMQEDWDRPCRLSFSFEGPGPLAHLLNDGAPLRESFVVDLSLDDVLDLMAGGPLEADLGPFDSLIRSLEIESELDFVDDRGGAVVEYSARGTRSSLRSTNDEGLLSFDVPDLRSTSESLSMRASASRIRYLSFGTLAGVMDFTVDGPDGMHLGVRSDFGDGMAYPDTLWYCP